MSNNKITNIDPPAEETLEGERKFLEEQKEELELMTSLKNLADGLKNFSKSLNVEDALKMNIATVTNYDPEFFFALRVDLEKAGKTEFLPTRANDVATGWDVRCADPEGVTIYPFEYKLIPLGFRMVAAEGYWFDLRPRSSTFAKKNLHCLYGVLDEDWFGESCLAVQYIPKGYYTEVDDKRIINWNDMQNPLHIDFGERIGQIIPVKRQEAKMTLVSNKDLDELYKQRGGKRGEGGFGSSGSK